MHAKTNANLTAGRPILAEMGQRLRAARIARGDSMAVFAQRIQASEGTLRKMESGDPGVKLGTWVSTLWVLDRLGDLEPVLKQSLSPLDAVRASAKQRPRQRAPRRHRPPPAA